MWAYETQVLGCLGHSTDKCHKNKVAGKTKTDHKGQEIVKEPVGNDDGWTKVGKGESSAESSDINSGAVICQPKAFLSTELAIALTDIYPLATNTPSCIYLCATLIWFLVAAGSCCFCAYSPLGSPGSWIKGEILKEPLLIETAEKLEKSPAQVALRWGLQSGHSVLPKSVNESRIKENLSLFDWFIPPELFPKLSGIHQQRLLRGDIAIHETLSPYKSLQELWDGEI
ncbi:Aldo-keto reductase family 4 member C9 [Morella rubra]|uniref:Aldo-keto reductase family 4 member C9 n=1 Tax=Morella rubra TaxID=262757 RepID=A0A6A1UK56_9ROSI|nr:Aldo-keto reductase family 4 member C9 [Morella rubra]